MARSRVKGTASDTAHLDVEARAVAALAILNIGDRTLSSKIFYAIEIQRCSKKETSLVACRSACADKSTSEEPRRAGNSVSA
jgi:hypothetical protein